MSQGFQKFSDPCKAENKPNVNKMCTILAINITKTRGGDSR